MHRTVEGTARTTADPSTVYALLRDRPAWPSWSSLGRYEHVGGTEGEIDAVCAFVTARIRSVERIVELVPDRRLSYRLESGLPVRDYRADVVLEPLGADAHDPDGPPHQHVTRGTAITWRSSFEPKVPGTGWFFHLMMRQVISGMATSLAREADRSTAAST